MLNCHVPKMGDLRVSQCLSHSHPHDAKYPNRSTRTATRTENEWENLFSYTVLSLPAVAAKREGWVNRFGYFGLLK